ncbi:MAG: TonB-dependent receptor, partial [Gemmatimonadales bacterium]|nr:TonB-dependent receptor [Gemmatimonadales bacterium]
SGFEACARNRTLLDSAAAIARQDDFSQSSTRRQFSPRIAISFPMSATSTVYFNFGRYSQNPLYNNLFQNTGIGLDSGAAGGGFCSGASSVRPGTTECLPTLFSDLFRTAFVGNTNLLIEGTTAYEVGYSSELSRLYGLSVALFSKDQYGLSGVKNGGLDALGNRVFDPGNTYGKSLLDYSVILNQDFQTVRGFEIQLRRRVSNRWGFNINYSFAQATTNAAPPELEQESQRRGDPTARQELRSEIDQSHVFNTSLQFRVGADAPRWPVIGRLLVNSDASVTLRAASGLPYTPTLTFQGLGNSQAERNSGRGPSTLTVDLQLAKRWTMGNLLYGGFIRVANLFNTRNCIQVFPTTGRCDAGTIDQSTRRQGNTTNTESSSFYNRSWYYSSERSINAGIRVSF